MALRTSMNIVKKTTTHCIFNIMIKAEDDVPALFTGVKTWHISEDRMDKICRMNTPNSINSDCV